jgi:hypothetical protein
MNKKSDKVDLLLQYLKGTLSARQMRKVEKLLASDAESRNLYSTMSFVYDEGRLSDWCHIRDSVRRISSRLYDDFQKSIKRPDLNYGVTIFDSKVLPLPEGVRPAAVDSRRLKFKIASFELDISLYPVSIDYYEIIGQVTGLKVSEPITVTIKSGKTKLYTHADQFNLFRLARVPAKKYTLFIISNRKTIGTVDIDI